MNTQDAFGSNSKSIAETLGDAEATLRLIANLPAPQGLENRVIAGVRTAKPSGRVLGWPRMLHPTENWLRSAAAAAIVFVVIGGGWGVYSRVQPISTVAVPSHSGGAFSNAGAVRVPQTVPAPVVAKPAPAQVSADQAKKVSSKVAPGTHRDAKSSAANKHSAQPVVSPTK